MGLIGKESDDGRCPPIIPSRGDEFSVVGVASETPYNPPKGG